MTIKQRFIVIFTGYIVLVICASAGIGAYFLHEAFHLFAQSRNTDFVQIMANQMFLKALIGFLAAVVLFAVISIPVGMLLSRQISSPYLKIFKNLTDIAGKRLSFEKETGLKTAEYKILERYISLLVADLAKIKEFEKEKSWKDGARMLMHELKNPLTPLKLSAQSLACAGPGARINPEDMSGILSSVNDIEKIFGYFKEMVNIEFGPLVAFDLKERIPAFCDRIASSHGLTLSLLDGNGKFIVLSEPTLIKMLFTNLINNGLSENPAEFSVAIDEAPGVMTARFITPHRVIEDASKLFKLGYSTKGKDRGFGLFLCKKISDYLDLNIRFNSDSGAVVFSVDFKRHAASV
jgi:two-component system, NtrC family, nitrogen regulation sensor histidine kinase NtrY